MIDDLLLSVIIIWINVLYYTTIKYLLST